MLVPTSSSNEETSATNSVLLVLQSSTLCELFEEEEPGIQAYAAGEVYALFKGPVPSTSEAPDSVTALPSPSPGSTTVHSRTPTTVAAWTGALRDILASFSAEGDEFLERVARPHWQAERAELDRVDSGTSASSSTTAFSTVVGDEDGDDYTIADYLEECLEAVVQDLVARRLLEEKMDCPFTEGVSVYAVLTEDGLYHEAVVLRELDWNELTEDGGAPFENEEEGTGSSAGGTKGASNGERFRGSGGGGGDYRSAGAESVGAGEKELVSPPPRTRSSAKTRRHKELKKSPDAHLRVKFFEVEFRTSGKKQVCKYENLIYDGNVEDDDHDEDVGEGECEICGREIRLTFHHLIPKETHRKWLKRRKWPARLFVEGAGKTSSGGGKTNLKGSSSKTEQKTGSVGTIRPREENVTLARRNLLDANGDIPARPNRMFLNRYGLMICRACHTHVHKLAPNEILAIEFNSLERLLADERMRSWAGWIGQRVGSGRGRR